MNSAPPSSATGSSAAPPAILNDGTEGDLATRPPPNLRQLTVVVQAKPPDVLEAAFLGLATRYKRLESMFRAAARGGFGSGFIMVRREQREGEAHPSVRAFVVTNWHVIQLATEAVVTFDGSTRPARAVVVYVHPTYDVAVLSLEDGDDGTAPESPRFPSGLELDLSPARDQEAVVASGYPGIDGAPSYQVTRGFVSNERFELKEGGVPQIYVQHTAPIDPGSSGGPLTTDQGKLLGVNTLKIRGRENVGLAVPAAIVAEALEHAGVPQEAEGAPSSAQATAACEELVRSLARGEDGIEAAERAIGATLVARDGLSTLEHLPRDRAGWLGPFADNPTAIFLRAVALGLMHTEPRVQGALASASQTTCTPVVDADATQGASFTVHLKNRDAVWRFGSEQHRFKLVSVSSADHRPGEPIPLGLGRSKAPKAKWKPSLKTP